MQIEDEILAVHEAMLEVSQRLVEAASEAPLPGLDSGQAYETTQRVMAMIKELFTRAKEAARRRDAGEDMADEYRAILKLSRRAAALQDQVAAHVRDCRISAGLTTGEDDHAEHP